jgi:flagellar biosynthesis protein FlhF
MAAGEVAHAVASLPEEAVILIDTPGCSPNDAAGLEEIGAIVGAADPAESVLVLPMSGDTGSMLSVREAFAGFSPSALVLTKLDEAPTPGAVLNMVAATGLDVWCVTDGRSVPGSLAWADAARLSEAVWEGRVCS